MPWWLFLKNCQRSIAAIHTGNSSQQFFLFFLAYNAYQSYLEHLIISVEFLDFLNLISRETTGMAPASQNNFESMQRTYVCIASSSGEYFKNF